MVSLRLSSILSYFFMIVVLVLFAKNIYGQDLMDSPFWTYLKRFHNETPYDYFVYKSCSPSEYFDDVDWELVLRLKAFDKSKPHDSISAEPILLKDPQSLGCLIKIEPSDEGKEKGAQTFYIKTGSKASGACLYDWANGPHDILVSPVYFDLFDEHSQKYQEQGKQIFIDKKRYCGYQESFLRCHIYTDGITFMPWHRTYVLDGDKTVLVKNIGEQDDKK